MKCSDDKETFMPNIQFNINGMLLIYIGMTYIAHLSSQSIAKFAT